MRLADLIGLPVVAGDERIGHVADVAARVGDTTPPVTALVYRRRHRAPLLEIDAGSCEWRAGRVVVNDSGRGEPLHMEPDELLLRRDVLDAQIVDTRGKRLTRVGDIELSSNTAGALVVAGVEVTPGAVVRRLGLRALARRMRTETLAWEHVHVAHGRGHELLLGSPAAAVHRLAPAELAEVVARLTTARGAEVLEARGADVAERTMRHTPAEVGESLAAELERGDAEADGR